MCVSIDGAGVRCWAVDLDVSVLDQQLKLFVSRHSALLSEHVPGEKTLFTQSFGVPVLWCDVQLSQSWTQLSREHADVLVFVLC